MKEALLLAVGRLVCTTPWYVICCVPFYAHRRISRSKIAAVITGISMLFFVCNFYLQFRYDNFKTHGSLVFCALYIILIGLFVWGFHVEFAKLLYVFLIAQAISTAINYIAAIMLKPFFKDMRISLHATPAYILAIFFLTMAVYPFLWYFFSHQLREAVEELKDRDFRLLCIPPVLIFVITVIFNDVGVNPAIPQSQAIAIFLLITASGLITYFLHVRLALDAVRRIRLEMEVAAIESQIAVQGQSYAQLTQNIESARAARHDLRHHLAAMSAFLENSDMEGLLEYLAEYRRSLPVEFDQPQCANNAVDVVVRYYLQQAKEAGAELDIKLDVPVGAGFRDTDLVIVFGNLFENAAQGIFRQTAGKRYITARCGMEQGKLILTIDNSTGPGDAEYKSSTGLGIGQSSVKAVAQKYHGSVRFEFKEDIYKASVLMVMPVSEKVQE